MDDGEMVDEEMGDEEMGDEEMGVGVSHTVLRIPTDQLTTP